VKVVYTLRHRLHHPEQEFEHSRFQRPFEVPERVEIIQAELMEDSRYEFVAPDEWGVEPIRAVHDPGLIRFLEDAWQEYQQSHSYTRDVIPDVFAISRLRQGMGPLPEPLSIDARLGYWCYETTTPITHGSYDAARSSVDVAMSAAAAVVNGASQAYGLCRPPGHHASHSLYGGYCFFNNAAVVAEHLVRTIGARVTVLDLDYHHGNGTQQIFYDRGDVQFVSLHADPDRAYPYHTGRSDECGTGNGLGHTVNFPLPAEVEDAEYLAVLNRALFAVNEFGPEILVVSLGLDTHFEDPISDFAISTEGLRAMGSAVAELGLPTVVLQEGGYAIDLLGINARSWLDGLAGYRPVR
jgi:acetoin utilization deacetylase AcuC-like enzyme